MLKHCTKCHIVKEESEFYYDSYAGRIRSECKNCLNSITKVRRSKLDKEDYNYAAHIRKTYGITYQQYEEMLEKQNGVCAICKKCETLKQKGKTRRLCIDHDHTTGKIRGLLCDKCNGMLTALTNSKLVNAAMSYIRQT